MPIAVHCDCGRALRLKDDLAGRKVRCPACGDVLAVPKPKAARGAEDEAVEVQFTDDAADEPPVARAPRKATVRFDDEPREDRVRRSAPERRPSPPRSWKEPDEPRERRPRSGGKRRRSGPLIVVSPEIITGCLMMLGALIWFFAGLAAGYIFFYPPVLFVLGVLAVIRGFTGGGD